MRCKFSERDIPQRLDHTICRFKGFPYYVRSNGGKLLFLYRLNNTKGVQDHEISADDALFDVSTPPLGYCQASSGRVLYVTRRPNRIYKQGLSSDAVAARGLRGESPGIQIRTKEFENMIVGVYPSLEATLKEFPKHKEEDWETAISRDIALKWRHKLEIIQVYYKNDDVGFMLNGTNTVIVPNSGMGWIVSRYLSQLNWQVQ